MQIVIEWIKSSPDTFSVIIKIIGVWVTLLSAIIVKRKILLVQFEPGPYWFLRLKIENPEGKNFLAVYCLRYKFYLELATKKSQTD